MANTVPTATQGVTVYSFSVAKCELKGCATVSAVLQESSKLPKACSEYKMMSRVRNKKSCGNLSGLPYVGWRLDWRALSLSTAKLIIL